MTPAKFTRGETPAKKPAHGPPEPIPSTEDEPLAPSDQLLAEGAGGAREFVPSSVEEPGHNTPSRPAEKRARADTVGTPIRTEDELERRERALRFRRLELAEMEAQLREQKAREADSSGTGSGLHELGFEFQRVGRYPSIVVDTAGKFPGVDPECVLAIYKNELDPMDLIKLRTGFYSSTEAPITGVDAYGSDMSLWAYCFTTFVAIYGSLFENHVHVVLAMVEFSRGIFHLAIIHKLRPVISFAVSRTSATPVQIVDQETSTSSHSQPPAVGLARRAKAGVLHSPIPVFAHAAFSGGVMLNLLSDLIGELITPLPGAEFWSGCFEQLQEYRLVLVRHADQLHRSLRAIRALEETEIPARRLIMSRAPGHA
ncbi:hypothetical protein F4823DRAFT_568664 [Ustulina deusta]|nr:hypothetical protein F4823DRAFT_568664 [Ustulina deusta]